MDADKKRIWIRGQYVEVTDEVYRAYMQGDRKMMVDGLDKNYGWNQYRNSLHGERPVQALLLSLPTGKLQLNCSTSSITLWTYNLVRTNR